MLGSRQTLPMGSHTGPDRERVAWSGTILASGCLDVTKMPQSTEQDQWIEMFGLGHKKFSRKQNATHVFLPEYHQYRTQVPLRRRARGEVTAGMWMLVALWPWF